ncbi:pimeloyl-ACP methyl ester carboxylesterase [Aeromicrobium panaciterrae]|uniref:Pimeloyl-ACP methyl ester carboxylesterase n=1 Tax=Aeromicrobium panaciterrae TaxID=363861 RepID=A0ABU1URF6_9ACTN|nr:alpha/beta hydrolase [Aeromicrobium panaciterrae]MDR7087730.1 pimeloyl-ACP methyl ester carboxylesterase [Aeromicrobium panaciterrae]
MNKSTRVATTAGAFVAAGVAATLLNGRQRHKRQLRRGEEVEFGSVHSAKLTVTASDGVKIHAEVDEGPRKTPTVVFIHGWVETLDVWHYQRLALRDKVRMVFLDQRSHGLSGRSHVDNSSIDQLADDLNTVLSELVPRGPIILVGHSLGGMAIMELAAAKPELFGKRVKGVALIATSSGRLARGSPALRRLLPLVRVASPVLDWGRAFNSYSIIRRWGLGPNALERHVDMTNEMILQAPTHVLMDFSPLFIDLDLEHTLKTVGKASTIVIGGSHDLLTPLKHSRRLANHIPGARLVAIEDGGHMLPFEANQQVSEAIESLVEELR